MRGTGTHVREVRAAEVDAAAALVLAAYRGIPGEDLSEAYAAELADVAERARHATVLVAAAEASLLGCVTFVDGPNRYAEWDDPQAAGIRMLAVAPEEQGRGVGALLVRACVDLARAAGRARLVLHSTEAMAAAQRLYVREGFVRAPHLDWEVRPGLRLLGYALPLDVSDG